MSDKADFSYESPRSAAGEIDHVELLSSQTRALYLSQEFADVTFIVENRRFQAHRVVLAARSEYFRALLFGGMKEAKPQVEIDLTDTTASAFDALLKYVYSGKIFLSDFKDETVLDLLGLAHKYGFLALESGIQGYLKSILSVHNAAFIFDVSALYQLNDLYQTSLRFLDRSAAVILSTEGFSCLSKSALLDIIKRDSFCAPEVQIFQAVAEWVGANPDLSKSDIAEVLAEIRLPLISLHDLFHTVRPSKLFEADAILDAIKLKTESLVNEMKFRGHLVPEENIATTHHGAEVIEGEMCDSLLDGNSDNYDLDRGFARHLIKDNEKGICIALGRPSIINTIKLLLWDKDLRQYSYYIEVSMDRQDWVRIIDYSKYLCRSWQRLHFKSRVVRYVRIRGVHNTVNKVFHLVHFECCYTNQSFQLGHGEILVPSENVATVSGGASVIEGVSRSRNALLNGDVSSYDWNSGYTCHQLGSGSIVVELPQPFIIDSMRLLLWDCDDRSYSYYIEVSNDRQEWTKVADKSNKECRAWQIIYFQARPVTFVRIVGVHNTANEVFHCVHFECPAPGLEPHDVITHAQSQSEEVQRPQLDSSSISDINVV